MKTYYVRYTVYEGDSSMVLSEGEMPVTCGSAHQAEETVKAMFHGNTVLTRGVRE
jgi:hypothetical protein